MQWITDPSWIAVLISMLAILATFFVYAKQKKRKHIEYRVTKTPLVRIESSVRQHLQVLYDGSIVPELSLVVVRIRNIGNQPVEERDFVRPIRVHFSEEVRVLSASLSTEGPKNLGAALDVNPAAPKEVNFHPVLMNPGDYFTANFIVNTINPSVSLDARIVGVAGLTPSFEPTETRLHKLSKLYLISLAVLFTTIFAGMAFSALGFYQATALISFCYFLVPLVGVMMAMEIRREHRSS